MRGTAIVILLWLAAQVTLAGIITGKVTRVIDGDTIVVLDAAKTEHKIRLAGIDTPEKAQAYGSKAKQALSEQIFGKTVTVTYSGKDRYGRIIGDVYWGKHWINLEMVAAGWAWHYKQYSDDERLADAETVARKRHHGLWRDKEPVPPPLYCRTPQEIRKKFQGECGEGR